MKAWVVRSSDNEYSTVVFAETRGKARVEALHTDCCDDMTFTEISPYRFPEADKLYKDGMSELEWENPEHRRFMLVHGWYCLDAEYAPFDCCEDCETKDVCEQYKNRDEEGYYAEIH